MVIVRIDMIRVPLLPRILRIARKADIRFFDFVHVAQTCAQHIKCKKIPHCINRGLKIPDGKQPILRGADSSG